MHSSSNLRDYCGWTYLQARKRIISLKTEFNHVVSCGENKKYLITNNGFTLLERLNELETDGHDLKLGVSQTKEEMEKTL